MLNLNFLEKGLELVSPMYFISDLSRKMFFMLHSSDQISLSGYLYFSRYWTISKLQLFVNQAVTS